MDEPFGRKGMRREETCRMHRAVAGDGDGDATELSCFGIFQTQSVFLLMTVKERKEMAQYCFCPRSCFVHDRTDVQMERVFFPDARGRGCSGETRLKNEALLRKFSEEAFEEITVEDALSFGKRKEKVGKFCLSTETGIVFCKKMVYPEIWKMV